MINTDNVLLFDLDGTVLNTDELIFESFRHTFKQFLPEYTLSEEELLSFLGPPLRESFARYLSGHQVDEAVEVYRAYNREKHNDYVTLYPHETEVLKKLHEEGIKMAIVTTKYKDAAVYGLKCADLDQYFDVVIGSDEVTHGKPHPEALCVALSHLNATKGYMIGDNVTDIQAVKNAGIGTIGVTWSLKGTQFLLEEHPDYMMESYDDLYQYLERM